MAIRRVMRRDFSGCAAKLKDFGQHVGRLHHEQADDVQGAGVWNNLQLRTHGVIREALPQSDEHGALRRLQLFW